MTPTPVLAGRFRWLLKTMCDLQEIDEAHIDSGLNYFENKANIESMFGVSLKLKPASWGQPPIAILHTSNWKTLAGLEYYEGRITA